MLILDAKEHLSLKDEVLSIYLDAFPAWEREDEKSLFKNVKSGTYKMLLGVEKDEVVGLCVLDMYGDEHMLLSFLAVKSSHRGKGFGSELVRAGVEFFRTSQKTKWLFIEAEHKQALLYQRLGFVALDMEYAIPAYNSKKSIKMNLLFMTKDEELSQESLKEIIKSMFTCGYALSEDDARLKEQLVKIPTKINTKEIH